MYKLYNSYFVIFAFFANFVILGFLDFIFIYITRVGLFFIVSIFVHFYIYIFRTEAQRHLSLARQAAVAPPRDQAEFPLSFLQITTEHVAEKPSKSLPNRSETDADSMKNVLGMMAATKRGFWGAAASPRIHGRDSARLSRCAELQKTCKQCHQQLQQ